MAISSSNAKALCSASEFSLVVASGKDKVKTLSVPQLRQTIERARKLRDKWRDQATKQKRAAQSKKGARQTSGNARSAEKAALFDEVLTRFEAEMAKPKAERGNAKRARKAAPLKVKLKSHRADRAEVRGQLKQKRLALASSAKTKSTKPEIKEAPSPPTESVANELPSTTVASGKKRSASSAAKLVSPPATTAAAAQGLQTSKRQQLRATTRAKQHRLKAAGIVRIQKHVSAQNKRRQAKRDSR
jgi:hypothetical protein